MDQIPEQLMAYIDQIAGLIGDAAPAVWEMAVRQVYIEIANNGITILFFVVLFFVGQRLLKEGKSIKEDTAEDIRHDYPRYSEIEVKLKTKDRLEYDAGYWLHISFGWILKALISFSLICLSNIVSRLINTNYYAVKILLQMSGMGGE